MAVIVMFTGPQPPDGDEWCAICAMQYKAEANTHFAGKVKELEAGGGDGVKWFKLEDAPHSFRPQVVVARGLFAGAPQLGALGLCWSHLAGIQFTALIPGAAGQLPGGAVDLSQRRGR